MDYGIAGKVALVMGGGGGLGTAIAYALHREAVRVVVADIDRAAAEASVATIHAESGDAHAIGWDLTDLESFPRKLGEVESAVGTVDILINNTGGPKPSAAAGVAPQDWRMSFESMVLSVMHLTDLVLPGMRRAEWGRIITSSSSGVLAPIENLGVSNTLRASLLGWSKTLAREVAAQGITSNVVVPGRIATQRVASLDAQRAQRQGMTATDVKALSEASIPMGRYGRPSEYANAVTFLASDAASYITGSILRVDGGLVPSTF